MAMFGTYRVLCAGTPPERPSITVQSLFLRYIFIRKKKGKKECDVALLSCEKIIAAVLVHFGGEWAGKGVT